MGPHFQNWPTSTFSPSVGPARTNPLQPNTAFSPSWRDKLTVFQSICRDYVHLHKVFWHRSKNAICRVSMSSSVAGYSTVSGSWKWMEQESPWSLVVSLLSPDDAPSYVYAWEMECLIRQSGECERRTVSAAWCGEPTALDWRTSKRFTLLCISI